MAGRSEEFGVLISTPCGAPDWVRAKFEHEDNSPWIVIDPAADMRNDTWRGQTLSVRPVDDKGE